MTDDRSRGDERRDDARLRPAGQALTVQYQCVSAEGRPRDGDPLVGEAINVSHGGMLLRGALPSSESESVRDRIARLLVGEDLLLFELLLEHDAAEPEPIRGIAAVRWARPAPQSGRLDLGLSFARLAGGDRRRLERRLLRRGRDSGRSSPRPEVL